MGRFRLSTDKTETKAYYKIMELNSGWNEKSGLVRTWRRMRLVQRILVWAANNECEAKK